MIQIPPEAIYAVVAISMGVIGAATRIYRQYKRDGEMPTTGLDLYVEYFLGAVAGGLSWLSISELDSIKAFALFAFSSGYAGVDFIETMVNND